MAYNVFYTSIPVLTCVLDKDLSEKIVMQNPQILLYCQAGRLLNPSTFVGWFGRSMYQEVSSMLLEKLLAAGIGNHPIVFVTHRELELGTKSDGRRCISRKV